MVTSPIVETDSWIWFLLSFMQTIPQKDFSWHDELIFSWYLFHKWNIIYVLHQRTGKSTSKNQEKHKTLQPSLPQRNALGSARSLGVSQATCGQASRLKKESHYFVVGFPEPLTFSYLALPRPLSSGYLPVSCCLDACEEMVPANQGAGTPRDECHAYAES